jgi:hypothetical protein
MMGGEGYGCRFTLFWGVKRYICIFNVYLIDRLQGSLTSYISHAFFGSFKFCHVLMSDCEMSLFTLFLFKGC